MLQILEQICAEFAATQDGDWPTAAASRFGVSQPPLAEAEPSRVDEAFVDSLRRALIDLAGAAGAGVLPEERQREVRVAIDGAELVIRGQLALNRPEEIRTLLPSLVFLITLPILQQDEALAIARRVEGLVGQRP